MTSAEVVIYLMDWPWVIRHSWPEPIANVTPHKINGCNLRIRAPWNPGKSSEANHHVQILYVNLRGCMNAKKKDAGDVQPSLNWKVCLHDVKSNLGPNVPRKIPSTPKSKIICICHSTQQRVTNEGLQGPLHKNTTVLAMTSWGYTNRKITWRPKMVVWKIWLP